MWMCPDLDGFRTYIKYPTYKCEGPCCTTPPFQPQDLEQTCESPIPRFGYPPVEDHGQSWPWLGHPQPWSFQHKIPCKLRCYSIFISGNGGFSSHIWWQMDTFFGIKLNRDGKVGETKWKTQLLRLPRNLFVILDMKTSKRVVSTTLEQVDSSQHANVSTHPKVHWGSG